MEIKNNVQIMDAIQSFQLTDKVHDAVNGWCHKNGIIKSRLYRKLQSYFLKQIANNESERNEYSKGKSQELNRTIE
jgi:hypothetical protein